MRDAEQVTFGGSGLNRGAEIRGDARKLAEAAANVNDSATEIRALRMARQLTNDDPSVLSLLA